MLLILDLQIKSIYKKFLIVVNSLDSVNSQDLTTKNYVDTEIGKIQQTDTAQFLKIDCTRSMTGDLDMDSYFIRNVGIDLADDSTAMPKSYIDARLNNIISYPITADINLSNFKITNLETPTADTDGSTKGYVDQNINKNLNKIRFKKNDEINVFKFLNDINLTVSELNITVNSFGVWTNSP